MLQNHHEKLQNIKICTCFCTTQNTTKNSAARLSEPRAEYYINPWSERSISCVS